MFIKNNLNWFSQTNFYVYVNIAPDYIHISVISPFFSSFSSLCVVQVVGHKISCQNWKGHRQEGHCRFGSLGNAALFGVLLGWVFEVLVRY